jgi:hypothetical protein
MQSGHGTRYASCSCSHRGSDQVHAVVQTAALGDQQLEFEDPNAHRSAPPLNGVKVLPGSWFLLMGR